MASYSSSQAGRIAERILKTFGREIADAVRGTDVSAEFMAGFVGVECGRNYKTGEFRPNATRFEPHVCKAMKSIRDKGYRVVRLRRLKSYNGLTQADLLPYSDEELIDFASSHGPTQIMGWHTLTDLKHRSIEDLSKPGVRFVAAVELLGVVAGPFVRRGAWESVLRIWNSGSPAGKTYDPDYVDNALEVKAAFKKISAGLAAAEDVALVRASPDPSLPSDPNPQLPASIDPAPGSNSDPETEPAAETQNAPAQDDTLTQRTSTVLSSVEQRIESIGGPIDRASRIASSIGARTDAVKSTRATVGGLAYQIFFAVFGFLAGLPWEIWLAVLVIGGITILVYLHRQTVLGKIRELKA